MFNIELVSKSINRVSLYILRWQQSRWVRTPWKTGYGNIISVNLAGHLVVVLHGFTTIREAFNQQQFSARPRMYTSEKVRPGVGVITSSGDVWTEIRRFSLTVLRGLGVGKSSFEDNIAAEAEFLMEDWTKYEGAAFDPRHSIANAVSNVICSVVFGRRFQYNDAVFRRMLECNDDIVERAGSGGAIEFSSLLARLTFLPFIRDYIATVRQSYNQIRSMVVRHNQDYDADNPRDFIDAYLQHQQAKERQGCEASVFDMDNLTNLVSDLFFAGSETTTTTLRWMLLYMMIYPEVQARVHKELDAVTGRNRFPRLGDKPDLPYTEAVICELQRITTIAPLAVPHACLEDTKLLGYDIPKGTILVSNLWHDHFDPTVWEEPNVFRPERFLDRDGKVVRREEINPFGIGRRICLGEHLARMELFIFITFLLHQFTFKKPQDAPPLTLRGINFGTWSPVEFKVCAIPRV
ncbi:cytochrome P450 2J6-like isoform X2 [Acanthaster planci]|uniref:Cytochrome P450 2J6-like isoform X2 n=1 Tax=Acanthaster planci TaxID=133434 RepID=A0A8B7YLG8_ACAPL|nr:cytochrome P450 2J6-like isoform X2 [Acanthaster planci]